MMELMERDQTEETPIPTKVPAETPQIPEKKVCAACGTEKHNSEFQRDRTHGDGLKSSCKECRNQTGRTSKPPKVDPNQAILNQAQNLAVKKLIENHMHEYKILVAAQLGQLGFKPKWRSAG